MEEIIFQDVNKVYEENQIGLENINFSVNKGEFIFIIGRSGAGKSTLIKLISGQIKQTSGQILVYGKDIKKLSKKKKPYFYRKIGIMQQELDLLDNVTVFENIMLVMRALEYPKKKAITRVEQTLKMMGILNIANKYPNQISLGERARALLARAVISNPSILVADEPTANLDPDTSWDIMCLLDEINRLGVTVIVISHNHELVSVMRKRVLTLTAGRLVADERNAVYNTYASDVFEERRILNERAINKTNG